MVLIDFLNSSPGISGISLSHPGYRAGLSVGDGCPPAYCPDSPGDAFCGGLIYGLRTYSNDLQKALDFAVSAGVQSLLLASSGAVYGKQPYDITHVPEEYRGGPDTSSPFSAYGEGKRVAELLGSFYAKNYGLQVKIARCFAFVGPHFPLDKHFAIGNFILNGINHQPIYIKGDGTPLRSYLYSSDLIIWLLTILISGKTCYPYNVGSEESVSIADLAAVVSDCFNPPAGIEINPNAHKAGNIEQYVPSVKRARTELGLIQRVSLRDAVVKTILFNREV